ncbi:MAG: DUF1015 domain-containing protein [Fibrobacteres bacterium]|nr:DUF1015 domain-containing protein [Fibrobacterota bacterium]
MAKITAFKALRARADIVQKVACVPYDVINSDEAAVLANGLPESLLHVTRPEIDLPPGTDLHSDAVYNKARENFKKFIESGILISEDKPSLYIYTQQMGNHRQTGVVACTSVDEYDNDIIKKHEKTRKDKEDDRTRHVMDCSAHMEPVFLLYRNRADISSIMKRIQQDKPIYDFTAADNIKHTLWIVPSEADNEALIKAFDKVDYLYVADGHHRSASASRTRAALKEKNPKHTGKEEYNVFMSVIFPDNELAILPYNRVVKDFNGRTPEKFIEEISGKFDVAQSDKKSPDGSTAFSMYMGGKWYILKAKKGSFPAKDPIASLDVSILQDNILAPVLGIADPRTDKRIDFVGGIRGVGELEKLVDSKKFAVAFSMYPTTVDQLMEIADANEIMPPKSTWFEPKLRSGLFIHTF